MSHIFVSPHPDDAALSCGGLIAHLRELGQNVVIDARQSVNGILSMEIAAHAAPDGATLSIGNVGTHVMNAGLYKKLPYDPVRDFVPISLIADSPFVLVLHPSLAARSVSELVAMARAAPGKFTMASAGVGNMGQLC